MEFRVLPANTGVTAPRHGPGVRPGLVDRLRPWTRRQAKTWWSLARAKRFKTSKLHVPLKIGVEVPNVGALPADEVHLVGGVL